MSENVINTLFELLNNYHVEVPIIQRDYAQGRTDEHATMVRDKLMVDMKTAIMRNTEPLDLNFVYGKVAKDRFIPIDGQQRLTTLFLLHLYAFRGDDSKTELLQKFTYKTRTSSRNFFEKLTKNRKSVFSTELIPTEEIVDSEWFITNWKNDPTIQSVLIMLDKIKSIFNDVDDLSQRLTDPEFEPIIFKFLDMDKLGMEDSLYIKLNARGKPLTEFENFKARLIGKLQNLQKKEPSLLLDFEKKFDVEWTDLFWLKSSVNFDNAYLKFFENLLMNNGFFENQENWTNTIKYDEITEKLFETTSYTLDYLSKNTNNQIVSQLIFNALNDKLTYKDRILFHAVTLYLYRSKGLENGTDSLRQWIRIIKNLVLNTQIDKIDLYHRAIKQIDLLSDHWSDLLTFLTNNEDISFFSKEQIEEERIKARLILQCNDFATAIYEAECHPYFNGQIRSALWCCREDDGEYNRDSFIEYWKKISELFEDKKPRNGHLLRRALLTFGDYTLPVGDYKTFCVDDPDEAASTPSLKRLFSNQGSIVKSLLEELNINNDLGIQLQGIVSNARLSKNDWRYCFVNFPNLFRWMSLSHLRLRQIPDELIIVPNKASNGYNDEVFSVALYELLKQRGINSMLVSDLGTWADRYLNVKEYKVRYRYGKFLINDAKGSQVFETKTDDPIEEATQYLIK